MVPDKLINKKSKAEEATSRRNSKEALSIVNADAGYRERKIKQPIILSYAADKPESTMTALEKMKLARTGISKQDLELLKQTTGLDYDSLAKGLAVTKATLFNKKGQEKFSADLSERIVSLADIYSYGYAVFEDVERFNTWMHSPNQALGAQAPYFLVDNQFGREEVKDLIGRIEYGVYS